MRKKWGYRFALEAKPNEPRGHMFAPTTGSYLGFINTLDHPEMVGVNPEFAHEQMAGLNFPQVVAEALEAGKLFHIDLNDQEPGRFDQDLRFASQSIKHAFFLVKLLLDYKYKGSKHFDSHAYRTADYKDVKAFAAGSMRSYKILEDKARRFNRDRKIQGLLSKIRRDDRKLAGLVRNYSAKNARALLEIEFNRKKLADRHLPYEQLDQLVFDLLMGAR